MQSDLVKLKNDYNAASTVLRKIPIPILPMNDVFQILTANSLKYYDVDFPPSDVENINECFDFLEQHFWIYNGPQFFRYSCSLEKAKGIYGN